jgi:hypothetical protein
MAHQSENPLFQHIFDAALQAYQEKVGVKLAEHPLALQLQDCHSVDEITSLLESQAQAFSDFQQNDKIIKSIKKFVSVLSPISSAASLIKAFGVDHVVSRQALVAYFTSLTLCVHSSHL